MQQAKGRLVGKRGVRLNYGQWYPNEEPKAVALVVHGYGEHMGRYSHVIEALAERGYVVFSLDHRGHGESEGKRANVERFDFFVEDLHLVYHEARDAHPGLPVFMVGHSLGGLISTHYALRYGDGLSGLVLSGPALQIGDDVSPLLKRVSRFLAQVIPDVPFLKLGENTLSRDPEVDRRFQEDKLCYKGKLKPRMGYELMVASIAAQERLGELDMPLLIMHGTADRLTNPSGSKLLYERAPSRDKTLKLWDDHFHEIFNELEKEAVIAYMLDWLDERAVPERVGVGV